MTHGLLTAQVPKLLQHTAQLCISLEAYLASKLRTNRLGLSAVFNLVTATTTKIHQMSQAPFLPRLGNARTRLQLTFVPARLF